MKTAKQELIELLERLPDDAPIDMLVYEVEFKASVLRGLADVRRGDVIDDAELGERIERWRASSGRKKLSER